MTDDLVRLLREMAAFEHTDLSIAGDAADEIERLRAEVATLRDQLATERDGLREQHARDSAELRRLCAERDKLRQQLAALREQIEKSPVAEPDGGWIDVAVPDSWNGNRVRLVRED